MSHSLVERYEKDCNIHALLPYHDNPRHGDLPTIVESLRKTKQYRPLIANLRTNEVLAGNHTRAAALELGWETIDVAWVDVDEDVALRIVLIDNRAPDLATYDELLLAALLGEVREEDEALLEGTGYTSEEVDELLADVITANYDLDFDDSGEGVSQFAAMMNRISPPTPEEQVETTVENSKGLIASAERQAKLKAKREADMNAATEWVAFRFGELRAKVPRAAYETFLTGWLEEHEDLSAAGVAACLLLGLDENDVEPAIAEGLERWL